MVATLRTVLENVDKMTESGSSLEESLKNARAVTERMAGKQGVLGGVLGGEDSAKKVIAAIDRANALLASLGGVSLKLDRVLAQAEQRVFGQAGVVDETQKAVAQANRSSATVRESLKKVDVHPRRRAGGRRQRESGQHRPRRAARRGRREPAQARPR